MKVSIIVAAYNIENYIKRCMDSIVSQTFKDIEIIVVNDGSTDNTSKIIESFANNDKRIKTIDKQLPVHGFNVATSNPPYMHMNGIQNPNDKKAISRHEVLCDLEDVIRAASRLVMPRGKFFMIHRPIRLVDIVTLGRKYNLEPKVIQFVHPRANKAPNLVLVEFTKDGRPELKVLDPLYVYDENGNYTKEIEAIYANENIGE